MSTDIKQTTYISVNDHITVLFIYDDPFKMITLEIKYKIHVLTILENIVIV